MYAARSAAPLRWIPSAASWRRAASSLDRRLLGARTPSDQRSHGDIFNPVDNAIAGIRYIQAAYGSAYKTPLFTDSAAYVGYDAGGSLPPGLTLAMNRTGQNEYVLSPGVGPGGLGGVGVAIDVGGITIDARVQRQGSARKSWTVSDDLVNAILLKTGRQLRIVLGNTALGGWHDLEPTTVDQGVPGNRPIHRHSRRGTNRACVASHGLGGHPSALIQVALETIMPRTPEEIAKLIRDAWDLYQRIPRVTKTVNLHAAGFAFGGLQADIERRARFETVPITVTPGLLRDVAVKLYVAGTAEAAVRVDGSSIILEPGSACQFQFQQDSLSGTPPGALWTVAVNHDPILLMLSSTTPQQVQLTQMMLPELLSPMLPVTLLSTEPQSRSALTRSPTC